MIPRFLPRLLAAAFFLAIAAPVFAQGDAAPTGPSMGLWALFKQSFDVFTVLLITGSVVALAVIFSCLVDIRQRRILPEPSISRIRDFIIGKRWEDLRGFVAADSSYVSVVLAAAISRSSEGVDAAREAAELAASEESARWFRRIELLNVIGNLGPLVGLAGTVWGMILAFTSLGEVGGQAGPSDLSLGISKALFHTLLGLVLAIPCLLAFGLYRSVVDRICTRGMTLSEEFVDKYLAANTK